MVEQYEEGTLVAIEFSCRRGVERKHAGEPEMDLGSVQSRTGLGFLEGCGGTDLGDIFFTGNVRFYGPECLVPPRRSGQGGILALDDTIIHKRCWCMEGRGAPVCSTVCLLETCTLGRLRNSKPMLQDLKAGDLD